MFQVLAPVIIHPTAEARQALGAQLVPAGKAAWREIARRGEGLEFTHLQICFAGITLAICSRLRVDGFIVIEIGLGDARQAARVIPATQLRRAEAQSSRAGEAMMSPHVGIVWGIPQDGGEVLLVTHRTPLAEAAPYGDFLTPPYGHYEVWEGWRRLGPAGLVRRGLPALIAWHEYEHFPRGRVVFHPGADRLALYVDPRLQLRSLLRRVIDAFGLEPARCDVRSDSHYRSVRDL